MKRATIIGAVLVVGFAALGFGTFRKTVTRYVTVAEAKRAGDIVQVYGEVDQSRLRFDARAQELRFPLVDAEGGTMEVYYRGVRPGNMRQATHCVATGQWEGDHFRAQSLLIKCPSKYQGAEGGKA